MQLAFCTVCSCHLSEWDNNFGTIALHCTGTVLTCSVYLFLKQCVTSSPYDTEGKKSTNIRMYMYIEDSSSYTIYNCSVNHVLYSGKLSREKTFTNWWKVHFLRRKLSQIAHFTVPKDATPPNFMEKTVTNSHKFKLRNSRKFSPSKVSRYMVLGKV